MGILKFWRITSDEWWKLPNEFSADHCYIYEDVTPGVFFERLRVFLFNLSPEDFSYLVLLGIYPKEELDIRFLEIVNRAYNEDKKSWLSQNFDM